MAHIISAAVCSLLVAADQITKNWAVQNLQNAGRKPFVPGLVELIYHINDGAAFGIFQGGRWVFLAVTAVILAVILTMYVKLPKNRVSAFMRAAAVLIVAGALGNAIDRARQGYVVDFMNFTFVNFPVFNVADTCIVSGSILMLILIIFFYRETPKNDTSDNRP